MKFEFYRFRFHFQALDSLYFPRYKSGNTLRGALGILLRSEVSQPDYARLFEPRTLAEQGPSGLAEWPRPFVFRASHLDGLTIAPGQGFSFDLHYFDLRIPGADLFTVAFRRLATEGLGPGRGRAELRSVEEAMVNIDLSETSPPVETVQLRFVTPTELKSGASVARSPEFGILFARLRDRISTLRSLYGGGPLDLDFRAVGERAGRVELRHSALEWIDAERRSSRTGQRHALGGFVGEVEFAGDLTEFVPFLTLGQWVGVGRQTSWGKGEYSMR